MPEQQPQQQRKPQKERKMSRHWLHRINKFPSLQHLVFGKIVQYFFQTLAIQRISPAFFICFCFTQFGIRNHLKLPHCCSIGAIQKNSEKNSHKVNTIHAIAEFISYLMCTLSDVRLFSARAFPFNELSRPHSLIF